MDTIACLLHGVVDGSQTFPKNCQDRDDAGDEQGFLHSTQVHSMNLEKHAHLSNDVIMILSECVRQQIRPGMP